MRRTPAGAYCWGMTGSAVVFALLSGLDDEHRRRLLGAATPRRFRRREVVFHEGDPGDCLHLVVSGRFLVRATTPEGEVATLRVVGPGEAFGELALVAPGARRTATVLALQPGHTLVLTAAQFAPLRARSPQVDGVLVTMLAENVKRMSALVVEMTHRSVEQRVAGRLVELGDVFGATIPMTQDDLAELAGTQRATANGVLRGFERRGLVALRRGRITVLDRPALARRAGRGPSAR
jgi:CRP/FNR family transcriptional regulator, cyclic AMP receptor protein